MLFVRVPATVTADTAGLTEVDRNEVMQHGQLSFLRENEKASDPQTSRKSEDGPSSSAIEGRSSRSRHLFYPPSASEISIKEQLATLG